MSQPSCNSCGRLILLFGLTLCLFSCQSTRSIFSNDIPVDDLSLQSPKKQQQVIQKAIGKLEHGERSEATKLIEQVLRVNPKQTTAKLLKRQLSQPPRIIFGTNRLTKYKIKANETLGSIAAKWLENSLYFVSLAELNHIADPSRILPGQIINIPVINSSPLVKKERRRSRANLNLLKKYSKNKQYLKSLTRMTTIFILPSHFDELQELQRNTLNSLAASRVSISERHDMVNKIRIISTQSKRLVLAKKFQAFINLQLHSVLMDEFELLFEDKSYRQSANKLIEANKLGSYSNIDAKFQETEKELIDKLHEKAVILRKDRKLEEAVATWQLILLIQPENKLAQKYYNRTNKLLDRLNSLN